MPIAIFLNCHALGFNNGGSLLYKFRYEYEVKELDYPEGMRYTTGDMGCFPPRNVKYFYGYPKNLSRNRTVIKKN